MKRNKTVNTQYLWYPHIVYEDNSSFHLPNGSLHALKLLILETVTSPIQEDVSGWDINSL